MASVSLQGIGKRYGKGPAVIDGVDLDIADGEFMVFVGPSGCGKSTLLRMIAGLETISAGELSIGGRRANELAPARRDLAMVFQSYALYPHMTVFENMAFALRLAGCKGAQLEQAVQRAAQILQITELLQRRPKDLSGGQRQRVAIGRAIVRKPGVFLFDEPLSNLDASLRVQMRAELRRLHQDLGATMVYVTHDQVEAMTLGQRIAVIHEGRIAQVGTPHALYNAPATRFVAGFLGAPKMNFIAAHLVAARSDGATIELADGARLDVPVDARRASSGASVTLGIRAEHVLPAAAGIALTVAHVEYLGDQLLAYATLAGCASPVALRQSGEAAPLAAGARIHVQPAPGHCHLFDSMGNSFLHPVTIPPSNPATLV